MNPKPQKPGIERAVGLFVILTVVTATVAVMFAARAHDWFRPMHELTIVMPADGSFGLRSGAPVELMGTRVGSINDITVDPETDRMTATATVRSDFTRFIGPDSKAVIRKTFAVGGDAFVAITRSATPQEIPEAGFTLEAVADRGPTDLLQQVVTQIQDEAIPALKDVRKTVQAYGDLADQLRNEDAPLQKSLANLNELLDRLRDPDRPLQSLLVNLNKISADIAEGRGALGRLVSDEKWADEIDQSLARLADALEQADKTLTTADASIKSVGELATNLNDSAKELPNTIRKTGDVLDETQGAIRDLRGSTEKLPALVDSLSDTADALPGLVLSTESTIRETERLIKAMQSHWLFRDYVPDRGRPARIDPSKIGVGP